MGAVDGRVLSGQISKAGSTHELLRLSTTHIASLDHIHGANLWNKLGKQRDASGQSHQEEVRLLLRRTVELMDACGARELSNIAHGLAKCRFVGLEVETGALLDAKRCRAAFSSEDGVASKLQCDVVVSLLALDLAPREEVRTPQGYSLDAVVLHGGREVAIEVDGPYHFCGRMPTGATALKRRQLRAAGWALLPVPYWEWDALGSDKVAKQEYLRTALQQVSSVIAA